MSKDYSMGKPMGNNGVPQYDNPPAVKALQRYVSENATASSVLTLTDNTTSIEIGTGGSPAVMRWVSASDTQASIVAIAGATANFDHEIAANTVRRFVVPIEVQNNSQGYSSMVGIRVANGLFARVAVKTQGIASVLVSEYGNSNSY